jgi:hypothetical protein
MAPGTQKFETGAAFIWNFLFLGILRFETDVSLNLRKVQANGEKRRNWLKTIPL